MARSPVHGVGLPKPCEKRRARSQWSQTCGLVARSQAALVSKSMQRACPAPPPPPAPAPATCPRAVLERSSRHEDAAVRASGPRARGSAPRPEGGVTKARCVRECCVSAWPEGEEEERRVRERGWRREPRRVWGGVWWVSRGRHEREGAKGRGRGVGGGCSAGGEGCGAGSSGGTSLRRASPSAALSLRKSAWYANVSPDRRQHEMEKWPSASSETSTRIATSPQRAERESVSPLAC